MMTETVEWHSELVHGVNVERNLVDITAYAQAAEKALSFCQVGKVTLSHHPQLRAIL